MGKAKTHMRKMRALKKRAETLKKLHLIMDKREKLREIDSNVIKTTLKLEKLTGSREVVQMELNEAVGEFVGGCNGVTISTEDEIVELRRLGHENGWAGWVKAVEGEDKETMTENIRAAGLTVRV